MILEEHLKTGVSMEDPLYFTTHQSAIGELVLVASNRGMRFVNIVPKDSAAEEFLARKFDMKKVTRLDGFFTTGIAAIDRFLNGESPLKLPVDLAEGTPLQRSVWLEIARIPYGETISYSTLADRVGFPRAVRAVASACGANPVPLVIPCHRVLPKDGSMGGFSLGGVEVKEFLLLAESQKTPKAAAA
jgi:O-6-methylguanine DNA methyltransferase